MTRKGEETDNKENEGTPRAYQLGMQIFTPQLLNVTMLQAYTPSAQNVKDVCTYDVRHAREPKLPRENRWAM